VDSLTSKLLVGGVNFKGVTDTNGECSVTGQTHGEFSYGIEKEGYYSSEGRYREWMARRGKIEWGKWQPWNPVVTQMIRKIVNPIPMYAKRLDIVIPVLDQFVGYDLMKGDWVSPYGSGGIPDFLFRIRKRYVNYKDYDSSLDIITSQMKDGVCEISKAAYMHSKYWFPREAPSDGYITNLLFSHSSTNYYIPKKDQAYLFRVRAVTNEVGEIVSALYGKTHGYFMFGVLEEKTGRICLHIISTPLPTTVIWNLIPREICLRILSHWKKLMFLDSL